MASAIPGVCRTSIVGRGGVGLGVLRFFFFGT